MTEQRQDKFLASDFEGFHYTWTSQARAREAALCSSSLDPTTRLLLLLHSELQPNGCCPLGPDVWTHVLKVDPDETQRIITSLVDVGILLADSDPWCLHAHTRFALKRGKRGRAQCGQQARPTTPPRPGRPASPRPREKGYPQLHPTGKPFHPPGTFS